MTPVIQNDQNDLETLEKRYGKNSLGRMCGKGIHMLLTEADIRWITKPGLTYKNALCKRCENTRRIAAKRLARKESVTGVPVRPGVWQYNLSCSHPIYYPEQRPTGGDIVFCFKCNHEATVVRWEVS